MGNASMGYATRVGAGAADPVTNEFDFLSCTVTGSQELITSDGIRGTRSMMSQQAAAGVQAVGGQLVMDARPDDLDFWLPYILGGSKDGATNIIALADAIGEFYLTVDKVAKVYTYAGCKVNSARFSGGSNQMVQMTLDIQGKTETEGAAGSFPDIAASLSALQPYVFHQGVLTIGGTEYEFSTFEVLINNNLALDRYNNSQTRTQLPPGPRVITLGCDLPFTADEVTRRGADATGAAGTLVFTNGTRSLTFTFANLKKPQSPVTIGGKAAELTLPCQFQAFATSAGDELSVTNDSTA